MSQISPRHTTKHSGSTQPLNNEQLVDLSVSSRWSSRLASVPGPGPGPGCWVPEVSRGEREYPASRSGPTAPRPGRENPSCT